MTVNCHIMDCDGHTPWQLFYILAWALPGVPNPGPYQGRRNGLGWRSSWNSLPSYETELASAIQFSDRPNGNFIEYYGQLQK